ncbi:hypothetical protein FB451DRAFT_1183613 [Mycena latifolia]|nr:hypothetical protein FB451DRAFT_1183613 [Mycena latifolia]
MTSHATCSGAIFSPYSVPPVPLPAREAETIQCSIDLQDAVYKALFDSNRRAARYDDHDGPAYVVLDDDGTPSPLAHPPTGDPRPPIPGVHQRRQNDAAKERRRKRRQRGAKQSPYERKPKARYSQRHRELSPERVDVDIQQDFSPSAGGAWLGARSSAPPNPGGSSKRRGARRSWRRLYTLPELYRMGCWLVRWNGRDPKLILDLHGRIVAILLDTPEDPDWDAVIADAVKEMARARRRCIRHGIYCNAHPVHRRGRYMPLTVGGSLGGGQRRPGNLYSGPVQHRITRRLKRNPSVKRIMGFQSSGLATYAPKVYRYKSSTLKGVFEHHPHLKHNFSNSIFPAATFNCGHAITFDHRDYHNLSHGFCGITCGGRFDSTLGGGLFRWAAYGYQSAKSLLSKPGGAALKQAFDGEPGARWEWALGLFSKHDELEADRAAIFSHA